MVAPLAVKVAVVPEQMVVELTVTVGFGVIVTVLVLTFVHPPVVPVTVYTVVLPGVTFMLALVAPVFQL